MRKLLLVFTGMFLLFSAIGFMKGRKDVSSPQFLSQRLMSQIEVSSVKDKERNRPLYELNYRVHGKLHYRFNIDTNTLEKTEDVVIQELDRNTSSALTFPVDESVVTALIGGGGATAGFTIKDIFAGKFGSKKQQILVGILGSVSGYFLGYKLGSYTAPGSDSPEVLDLIDSEAKWREIKKQQFLRIALRTFQLAHFLHDEKEREENKRAAALIYRKGEEIKDLNSGHYDLASWLYNKVANQASADLQMDFEKISELVPTHPIFWLSWWWLGTLLVIVFVIVSVCVWWTRRTDAAPAMTHKPLIQAPTPEEVKKFGS
jgi:hypothetical protein